jgi:hypothetical protein
MRFASNSDTEICYDGMVMGAVLRYCMFCFAGGGGTAVAKAGARVTLKGQPCESIRVRASHLRARLRRRRGRRGA